TVGLTSLSREQYSNKDYLIKYPILSFVSTLVNAFGSPVVGFIYDGTRSYNMTFVVCIIMALIMLVDLFLLERKK
ncbi:MAG: hypothetical protein J6Z03_08485, partial [Erysipelotrichaceae bacterium]|nr:hypothetical protein [Erysipelotrichaceae bacterium]